jgi:fucose permease
VFVVHVLNLNYSAALILIGIFSCTSLFLVFKTDFPRVSPGFKFSMAFKVLLKPAVLVAALALFCYTSLEASMGTWIKKLMEELYGGSTNVHAAKNAGLVLSLFGVAMMAGRFLSSAIRNLTSMGSRVIVVTSMLAVLAILMMMVARSPVWGIFAILVAGLVFAPIFPTIIGITFAKFDPGLYGSIFGIIFSIGLLGGTFVPKFIGNLSVGSTVQESLSIAAIMAAILLFISFFLGRIGKPKPGQS